MRLTPLGKVMALALALVAGGFLGAGRVEALRAEWRCVRVQSGDSLWRIARDGSGGDPRPVVSAIVTRNRLPSAFLSAGERLWVPEEAAGGRPDC